MFYGGGSVKKAGQIYPESECNIVEKKSLFGRLNGKKASLAVRVYTSFIGRNILINFLKKRFNLNQLMGYTLEDEPCEDPILHTLKNPQKQQQASILEKESKNFPEKGSQQQTDELSPGSKGSKLDDTVGQGANSEPTNGVANEYVSSDPVKTTRRDTSETESTKNSTSTDLQSTATPIGTNVVSKRLSLDIIYSLIDVERNADYLNIYPSIQDYHQAYKSGVTTPLEVAEILIDLLENDDQVSEKLNAVTDFNKIEIIKLATESTERFKNNCVLSIIDGVPFFSKEDIPKQNYIINCGTNFYDTESRQTAVIIDRLLDAGAIFMGITRMTMLGYGTIGTNPVNNRGHVRNPYNSNYYCGGSSTGSAAVVAAGLCPFSIGVDGVGSNRIPPATTGVNGLKATFARVPLTNFLSTETTNAVPGPIAASVKDIAIIYGVIAGPCSDFLPGLYQPQVELPEFSVDIEKLRSIRFGFDPSFSKKAMDSDTVQCVFQLVNRLRQLGANVVEFTLEECWQTIVACQCQFIYEKSRINQRTYGEDKMQSMQCCNANLIYNTGLLLGDDEYLQMKKQRTRSINIVKNMFSKVDILLSPTIGSLAPIILPNDEHCGVLDDLLVSRLTRFVTLASFTGIPALALSAGFKSSNNLPLSVQLQASWWREKDLLEAAYLIEQLVYVESRVNVVPQIFKPPIKLN